MSFVIDFDFLKSNFENDLLCLPKQMVSPTPSDLANIIDQAYTSTQ